MMWTYSTRYRLVNEGIGSWIADIGPCDGEGFVEQWQPVLDKDGNDRAPLTEELTVAMFAFVMWVLLR